MQRMMIMLIVFILPLVYGCPSSEKLRPCKCIGEYNTEERIICPGLESEQTLIDAMHAFQVKKKFNSFTIENSNFRYLPHGIFKGIQFQEFKIASSLFMSLTDTDFAFEGQEEDLVSLIITDSLVVNSWDWSVLKNLKQLLKLSVEAGLTEIAGEIGALQSTNLKDISFPNNKISYVNDTAFSVFKSVMAISLRNNLIREVKRSMMPNPAPLLWKLDFSCNEIQQLPSDLFANMPSLTYLNLTSNQILTLNEKPLADVWAGLDYFDAINSGLRCDCRMIWMTKFKKPQNVKAVCDQPMHLKGKNILEMTEKDLWC